MGGSASPCDGTPNGPLEAGKECLACPHEKKNKKLRVDVLRGCCLNVTFRLSPRYFNIVDSVEYPGILFLFIPASHKSTSEKAQDPSFFGRILAIIEPNYKTFNKGDNLYTLNIKRLP